MNMNSILIGLVAILVICPMSAHAASADTPKLDSCTVLKPDDLTALLGGTAASKSTGESCSWKTADKTRQLTVLYSNSGMGAEMAFMSARKKVAKGGAITDLKGIGDRAFSRLFPSGVMLMSIKQGQLLQLQYRTGEAGTSKDLDELKTVAKKAIASF